LSGNGGVGFPMSKLLTCVGHFRTVFNGDPIGDFGGVFVFGRASFSAFTMGTWESGNEVSSIGVNPLIDRFMVGRF